MHSIKRLNAPYALQLELKKKTPKYRIKPVLDTLTLMYSKCYTCNTSVVSGNTIEHIHPKSTAKDSILMWENLIICCNKCNETKNKLEKPVIDPTGNISNIEKLFKYNLEGEISPNDVEIYKRFLKQPTKYCGLRNIVENTINLYGLNRRALIRERHNLIIDIIYSGRVSVEKNTEYKGMILSMQNQLERIGVIYE